MATQKIIFQLVVEDSGLTSRIEQTRATIRSLNKEIRANPGPERFAELTAELAASRRVLADLVGEQKKLTKEFQALKVPKDSLAGLRLEYGKLSQAVAQLSAEERKSSFGKELIKNAAGVKKEIDGIEQSMGRFTGNVGNYRSALNGLGSVFAALGIGAGIGEIINANTRVSDAIADVAKTAGIATNEAQQLADVLEFRDTRTSLVDQLKIAQIGGQLGVAKEQLLGFTESVDVLNVSLGDQFGNVEEITRVIAGLRNVLTDFKTGDVSNDVLRLGNALNFLEAQGNATAPTIAEFVNRISGSAIPLGVTTQEIFGLSTALAELNINPERGATAITRLLIEVARTPEVFAKSLGFTKQQTEDFAQQVNTDLVGAVALVSKTIAEGGDGVKNFAQTLDEIGIDRAGAIEVLGKLGGNTALLTQRITESTDALQATDSVYAEFDKKNNNAAAAVEKLQNAVVNLITSEGAQDAIESVAKAATNLVNVLGDTLAAVSDNKAEFALLASALFAFTGPGQAASAAIVQITTALKASTVAGTLNVGVTNLQTAATRALAAAQAALPLLAVVAGIYAVVKAFETYNNSLSASEKATRAVSDAQKEIAESSAEEIVALNAGIGVLKDNAASQEERAAAIKSLTEKYPEYLKGIDLEKQSIAALTTIQRELTEEVIRGAAARAKTSAQSEVATKIIEKELKIAELRRSIASGEFSFQDREFIIGTETAKLAKLREQLEETGKQFDEVFKLNQPAKSSVIEIVDQDSVKAQAAEAKKTIKAAGADLTKEEQKAADKAKSEREKRASEESKRVEDQQKRILEIQRTVRDLNVTEESEFLRKVEELDNRRTDALLQNRQRIDTLRKTVEERTGTKITGDVSTGAELAAKIPNARPADITEANLIDAETDALKASFDKQRTELFAQRKATQEAQAAQLRQLLADTAKVAADNEATAAVSVQQDIQESFEQRRTFLEKEFSLREEANKVAFSRGEITRKEFEQRELSDSIEQTNRKLQLETEYATRVSEVVNQVRDVRVAAAQAELDAQLLTIEQQRKQGVAGAEKTAKDTGTDASAQISAINEKAANDAEAAQLRFADAVKASTDDAKAVQLQAVDAVDAARQATHDAELARIESEKQKRAEIRDAAVQTAGEIASGLLAIQRNNDEADKEAKLSAIDEEYEKKKKAAQGNAQVIEKLEKEQAKKKEAVEKEAAEKRKQIAIIEAVINTAQAIVKAAPNPLLMAFAAAVGAVQVGVISSQKFAEGGFTDEESAAPGPSSNRAGKKSKTGIYPKKMYDALPDLSRGGYTGQGTAQRDDTGHRIAGKIPGSNAVVHAGEYVAPAWQVQAMPELFGDLESQRRKKTKPFAQGGFTHTKINFGNFAHVRQYATGGFADPVLAMPNASEFRQQMVSVSASASFTDAQIQEIGRIIAAENGRVVQRSIAEGLGDANRRLEREKSLEEQRTI